MSIFILLNAQIYQAPESVIMNHSAYLISTASKQFAMDHICKNKMPCLYVDKKD